VSRTDREILEELYARWNAPELALDLFDEDVDVHQNPDIVDTARTFRGHAGMATAARELNEAFVRLDWLVEAWFQEGEWILARVNAAGTGRASGIVQRTTVAHAWRLRDGKITHLYVYPSMSEAVRALQSQPAG
jgi:ketosteroid isomerase-like protein